MTQKKKKKVSPEEMGVDELEEAIRHHNRLYFELQKPEISDYEFDRLVERLKKMNPHSAVLTEIPSEGSKELKKVRHTSPMLSLDKCYTDEDLNDWASKFEGEVIASPKIDGCATELRYNEKGELILGATRGDGYVGEDITANVRKISDIPQKIPLGPSFKKAEVRGGGVEIRGEIYMRLSIFEKKYKGTFANPRNLAAGAIKQKDPRKTQEYQLSFFGYDVLGIQFETEEEKFKLLKGFKIPTVDTWLVTKDKMKEAYTRFLAGREDHDYETDGVVLKADLISEQERLGYTAHHPRYSIAYKFQGDSGTTRLIDVEWNVARTGVITPVGVVEPVALSGAMVSRVSLHNLTLMKKLGLRKGSQVVMMRRGGVIPNLEFVAEAGHGKSFEVPKVCPSCGSPTEIRDDFLYCTNKHNCRSSKMQELEHFMKVIECDGFGEKLIEKLYDSGFVQDPSDFYTLQKGDLLELERMGETLANKLIGNIQAKSELSLDTFLRALGIRELAKHTSKLLMKHYGTLGKLMEVSEEELSAIHTIGPVIAQEIVEGLRKKKGLIQKLLKYVDVKSLLPAKEGSGGGLPLHNKKFVFTGTLLSMTRNEAQKWVEGKGGETLETVTKDLDYLVVGDGGGAGSKLEKAKKLQAKGAKVKILSEVEWKKLIE